MEHIEDAIKLTQKDLINRVLIAMGLEDIHPKCTLAPKVSLGKDLNGSEFSEEYIFPIVVLNQELLLIADCALVEEMAYQLNIFNLIKQLINIAND